VLQFLEQFTGVREPNISDWRRSTFGDLTSAFRFAQADIKLPRLPDANEPLIRAMDEVGRLPKPIIPDADQAPPKQEAGSRKRV
jgi:phospholipase C